MENNWKAWLIASAVVTATTAGGVTSASAAAIPNTGNTFSDLNGIPPEQTEAIREAARLGFITGFPNNEYRPEQVLTRQELAILLVKTLNLPVANVTTSSFSDVSTNSWASRYVEAARAAGLMNGNGAGGFRPQATVSREELASVLVRAVNGQNTSGGLPVNEGMIGPISDWARNSVETAARLGLIQTAFTNSNLKGGVTRADIAPFLVNIFPEKETTSTITSVNGDTILLDNNKPLLVTESLKQLLLSGDNAQALTGATLTFKSARHSVGGISEIELVGSGTAVNKLKFDASTLPTSSTLKLSGDYVVVEGSSIGNLTIQKSANHVELNTNVRQLQIEKEGALELSGTVNFGELRITNPNAKITLGPNVQVERIILPPNVSPTTVLNNASQLVGQIKQVVTTSGAIVSLPTLLPATPTPSVTPSPVTNPPSNPNPVVNPPVNPPVDPPVNPPVNPPVDPPVNPPVNPPVDPPIDPPVDPPVDPNVTAVEQDRTNLAIGFRSGDSVSSITYSITLPGTGAQGSAISWASDNEAAISSSGTVTRAVYGSGDTTVVLTATLTKGDVLRTQGFTVIVKQLEAPMLDKQALLARIEEATTLLNTTPVGTDEDEVPQQAATDFALAIQAAEQVHADSQADQAAIDLAKSDLDTAISDFEQAMLNVSKQLLGEKIGEAQTLLGSANEGDSEGNVPVGTKTSFAEKIQEAQDVLNDSNATRNLVNTSRLALIQYIEQFEQAKVVVDRSALSDEIATASAALANADIGIAPGQVTQANYDLFNAAIQTAQTLLAETPVTQAKINTGISTLTAALEAFNQAENKELTMKLAPDAEFILNNTNSNYITINDDNDLNQNGEADYMYTKRSILNYIRVESENYDVFVEYDSGDGLYHIYADGNVTEDTGRTIEISSTSTGFTLTQSPDGIELNQNYVADNSTAVLEFKLKEGSREISTVQVQVRETHKKPLWIEAVYEEGTITVESNERMRDGGSFELYYSASGDFTDQEPLHNTGNMSGYEVFGKDLTITLNPTWLSSKGTLPAGSKFKVITNGFSDYGDNVANMTIFEMPADSVTPVGPSIP